MSSAFTNPGCLFQGASDLHGIHDYPSGEEAGRAAFPLPDSLGAVLPVPWTRQAVRGGAFLTSSFAPAEVLLVIFEGHHHIVVVARPPKLNSCTVQHHYYLYCVMLCVF